MEFAVLAVAGLAIGMLAAAAVIRRRENMTSRQMLRRLLGMGEER